MPYYEQDFADMLFAWPAVEGRIIHLYELDPTHASAQPSADVAMGPRANQAVQPSRTANLYCALNDSAPAAILLELDPTHTHAR
jgi:hypothetical protein